MKYLLSLFILGCVFPLRSQFNYIQNPSIEDSSEFICGQYVGTLPGWYNSNKSCCLISKYDSINNCYSNIDKNEIVNVPDGYGFLSALSSNPKCISNNYPTNILNKSLKVKRIYVLSYQAKAAPDCGYYHDHFDVDFYTVRLDKKENVEKRLHPPQLTCTKKVYDEWETMEYVFQADSAYKFMMMGQMGSIRHHNYERNENTDGGCSHYYFDDFKLIDLDSLFLNKKVQFLDNDSLDFDSKKLISDASRYLSLDGRLGLQYSLPKNITENQKAIIIDYFDKHAVDCKRLTLLDGDFQLFDFTWWLK